MQDAKAYAGTCFAQMYITRLEVFVYSLDHALHSVVFVTFCYLFIQWIVGRVSSSNPGGHAFVYICCSLGSANGVSIMPEYASDLLIPGRTQRGKAKAAPTKKAEETQDAAGE